ncbi:uncharacterized protein UTRI_03108 [Ustilago trichophora]|uniref:Uncharacterized protein n=1 Tax=Ustilago trichophora TaxID=86804 RepID=A0A5C3E4U7_9BASI|nr:uncharacterized protein UTRI_03108 [Ustilago trichophora]
MIRRSQPLLIFISTLLTLVISTKALNFAKLVRRELPRERCTSNYVNNLWQLDRPDNATAGLCYSGKYDLADWSPTHYLWKAEKKCLHNTWYWSHVAEKYVSPCSHS